MSLYFFFQAEDGIRDAQESRGLGDVYKRQPITNTTMLGALIKATKVVKLASVAAPLEHRFGRIAPRNQKALQRAYDEVKIH